MRLKYIDALRGFTMFLVVFWHIMSLGFGLDSSLLGSFFRTFRMPTFFFVSGFIGYKAIEKFTFDYSWSLIKKKAFVQLVPTAIIFSLYKFTMGDTPFSFFDKGLVGYWFTLALFEMFMLYYATSFLFKKVGGERLQLVFIILIILLSGEVGLYFLHLQEQAPRIVTVLSLGNVCIYLPFFCVGLLARKYFLQFRSIITNTRIYALLVLFFVIGFILIHTFWTKQNNFVAYYIVGEFLLRYIGLFLVFSFFLLNSSFFDENGRLSRIMQFVGSRTLDIYLLHYFFIPDLKNYNSIFIQDGKEFVVGEFFIIGLIAVLTIAFCLLISAFLRKSDVLAKYCFGIIPKK